MELFVILFGTHFTKIYIFLNPSHEFFKEYLVELVYCVMEKLDGVY